MIEGAISRTLHSIGMRQTDPERTLITSCDDIIAELCRRASTVEPRDLRQLDSRYEEKPPLLSYIHLDNYSPFPSFIAHSWTKVGRATAPYCMQRAIQAMIEAYNGGSFFALR